MEGLTFKASANDGSEENMLNLKKDVLQFGNNWASARTEPPDESTVAVSLQLNSWHLKSTYHYTTRQPKLGSLKDPVKPKMEKKKTPSKSRLSLSVRKPVRK